MILSWYPLNPDDTQMITFQSRWMIPPYSNDTPPPSDDILSIQMIPPWSRWYSNDTLSIKMIPTGSRWYPPSRWYNQMILRWYPLNPDDTTLIQMIPPLQMIPSQSRWYSDDTLSNQMTLRWYPLIPDDTPWFKWYPPPLRWNPFNPDDTPLIQMILKWYPLNPGDIHRIQMIPPIQMIQSDDTQMISFSIQMIPPSRWYSDDTLSIQIIPPDPDDTLSRWYNRMILRWYPLNPDDTLLSQMIPPLQMILRRFPLNPDDTTLNQMIPSIQMIQSDDTQMILS
jgi:hypothetical protein